MFCKIPENTFVLLKSNYQFNYAIYQIGYEECSSNHSFGPVLRDFYVLHFIVDGEGTLEINNKQEKLVKGDLFLVPKSSVCRYFANPNHPYKYYWIGFSGPDDKELLTNIGFIENDVFVVNKEEIFDQLLDVFKEVDELIDGTSISDNLKSASILYKVLSMLVKKDDRRISIGEQKDPIQLLTRYIELNYNTKITMDDLEKVANMHRSNVYRIFLKYYDLSPSQYIENVRMEKALYLLKNTDYSIKKIALLVGYSDSVCFCKAFKNKHKKTPTEARNLK